MRIAITGGTGLVGGHLAKTLADAGHEVVVVARGVDQRPWAAAILALPEVRLVRAAITDQEALRGAFDGCDAVAHCAGINREIGSQTYQAVHVEGTARVVRAAEGAGVTRLALVSFLRARPACGSAYHESKWEAEQIVRASALDWTVLKPGMIFGRGDHMLDHLSHALRTFPVYIGVGSRRVRPLAVEDLVTVLSAALVDGRLSRQTVAVLGPDEMPFDDAAHLVAQVIGARRPFLTAPIAFHYLLARIAEKTMTVPLIATGQVRILEEEVVEPTMAPDRLPDDLVPRTPFNENSIRVRLPEPGRFGLADLRAFSHRRRPRSAGQVEVCGEGSAVINRSAADILEFVLDVDRYRQADLKIGRVRRMQRTGNSGLVRHATRFMGLPAPAVTLSFELSPYTRLDFVGRRMPWPLRGFSGFFTCEESGAGTVFTHRECFLLGAVIGPMFKAAFGGWLARDTAAEVLRMKALLESPDGS
jgi:uncharacterized protein YbjT (DUF2867 family)